MTMRNDAQRFVHLRVHTAYSLLEGGIRVKALAGLAERFRMAAVGVTDTGNLFGALEISDALAAKGIQPIIGCTFAIETGQAPEGLRGAAAVRRARMPSLVLIAKDETGYLNLMELSSRSFFRGDGPSLPHLTVADLAECGAGLICLTGGPEGPVNRFLVEEHDAAAELCLDRLHDVFGDRLYVELQRHGVDAEIAAEPRLVQLAYAKGLPLVATNEPYFPSADDYESHDALLCIADGAYVHQGDRRRLTPEHYFRSQEEMCAAFADVPEAIANTVEIAQRCAFRPVKRDPILPRFAGSEDEETAELRRQAEEGLRARLAVQEPFAPEADYWSRLAMELDVIARMKFPGYFLIVADFIKWAKGQGIPVGPGRGSGAGSVVAWALTITDLDPLRFGLLFERFLNPERVSMPDFDIDFCQDRRDEVIRYVQQKYGADRVAQIITFGTLQARAALRDVGRVLGMAYKQVDELCKLVPNNPANPVTLEKAIADEPKLQEKRAADEAVANLLDTAIRLEGLYRHASTHAAGVVIGDRNLRALVPLYRDPRSDMPVTQFSMKWVENAGLVKFDFLGLKTLTVLDLACRMLAQRGVSLDLGLIPLDDKATYVLLGKGDATGIFQLESQGMRDTLKKLKPDCIEDIIALVALYRPGPMDNIPAYIERKRGERKPDYLHPKLEPVLTETYGVIIYQEQVMQIAQVLSGYSLGEADLLRRAMGKKIKAEMDKQKARFVDGAVAGGVEREQAAHIFELVEKFAGYGFNKSHAAAYAIVAYQTAYLKANHPVEFMAATMTLDMHNTAKLNVFRQELDRLGIALLPPDVNVSEPGFAVEQGKVRYALGALKNVGVQAMEILVEERKRGGPFRDLFDFARRLDPQVINRRALDSLARAGAFDSLNKNRAQVVAAIDLLLEQAGRSADERAANQTSLFGVDTTLAAMPLPQTDPWPPLERLAQEFDAVGFYLSGHPLDDYRGALARAHVTTYAALAAGRGGADQRARLAGVIISIKERRARSGAKYAFVECSDPSGRFEAMVFSETLSQARDDLVVGRSVVLSVTVDRDGEEPRLRVQSVAPIESVIDSMSGSLRITLDDERAVGHIKGRLVPDGSRGSILFLVPMPDRRREVEIRLPGHYATNPRVQGALRTIPGVLAVEEL